MGHNVAMEFVGCVLIGVLYEDGPCCQGCVLVLLKGLFATRAVSVGLASPSAPPANPSTGQGQLQGSRTSRRLHSHGLAASYHDLFTMHKLARVFLTEWSVQEVGGNKFRTAVGGWEAPLRRGSRDGAKLGMPASKMCAQHSPK